MAILIHKPARVKFNPEHNKILSGKLRYGKILNCATREINTINNIPYDLSEYDDHPIVAILGYAIPVYPIIFDGYYFFHEGPFSTLVSGDEFVQKVLGKLTPDGNMSFTNLLFTPKDASILVGPDGVIFSKFAWQSEGDVKYSNTDYKPYYSSTPISNAVMTNHRVHHSSSNLIHNRCINSPLGVIEEVSLGMSLYFKSHGAAKLFVSHTTLDSPLRPMDFIITADGIHSPSFEYVQGLFTGRRNFTLQVLRYPLQDPDNPPVKHLINI